MAQMLFFNGVDLDGRERPPYRKQPIPNEDFRVPMPRFERSRLERLPRPEHDCLSSEDSGWGYVVHEDEPEVTLTRLSALLRYREAGCGPKFHSFIYRDGQTMDEFLVDKGIGAGDLDPMLFPYYLLIIGPPDRIPFIFQTELMAICAVGRLDFDDAEDYARYGERLIEIEKHGNRRRRETVYFGPVNGDRLTELSRDALVEKLHGATLPRGSSGWPKTRLVGEQATRTRLESLLCDGDAPALLFAAGHGVSLRGDERLRERFQGSLICSDWQIDRKMGTNDFFGPQHLREDGDRRGMIAFLFTCFSGGTPRTSVMEGWDARKNLHHREFTASFPKTLLGGPKGALAVIAHVDSALQYSFLWRNDIADVNHFGDCLAALMRGEPVGHALAPFRRRVANIGTRILGNLLSRQFGEVSFEDKLLWSSYHDAKNYIVLGDPAARLCL